MSISIGSYKLPSNIILAPMAGVTDLPFRLICRENGAKFCFFEMIDCNSIIFGKKRENDIIKTHPKDRPIAAQLVGPDPDLMLKAAKELVSMLNIKFLDINAACPVPKMVKKKAGAYLIKEPANLYRTVELLSLNLDIPITVKLRTGYHRADHAHIADVASKCEMSGASALFVHGRTQDQGYSGEIDYEAIKVIKRSVKIPVFGSGNIFDPMSAKKMFDSAGCDGIIVARGAYGDPWIFKDIEEYLKSGKLPLKRSVEEKLAAAKKHIGYIEKYRNMTEHGKIGYMRKVAQWYMRDFRYASPLRRIMDNAKTIKQLLAMLDRVPEIIESS